LKKAGYALVSATPIDQFPYSDNLESVMVFELLKQ
jgi:tRNA/tmRNA/rRNA uracil-C5-methylase (TrmA/RlmC/RlmD family)